MAVTSQIFVDADAVAPAGTIGRIITWDLHGRFSYLKIKQGLKDNSFCEKLAKTMLPKHALLRACKKLEKARIIRMLPDDKTEWVHFQFTDEAVEAKVSAVKDAVLHVEGEEEAITEEKRYAYKMRTVVHLNRKNGKLVCEDAQVLAEAQAEMETQLTTRTTNDVSGLVKRILRRERRRGKGDAQPHRAAQAHARQDQRQDHAKHAGPLRRKHQAPATRTRMLR